MTCSGKIIHGSKFQSQSDRNFDSSMSMCVYTMSVYVHLQQEVHSCVCGVSNKGDKTALVCVKRALNLVDRTIIENDKVSRVYIVCAKWFFCCWSSMLQSCYD